MRLIDADELKKAFEDTVCIEPIPYAFVKQIIDNAPTIEPDLKLFKEWKCADCEEREKSFNDGWQSAKERFARPQGKWFDCIEAGTLKARHGDYVLYKVDFLLDNLTREVYIMEGVRRMRGVK